MLTTSEMREVFIKQVEFVGEIAEDILKHNCSEEVIEHVKGYAHVENEYGEFWRVNWGGAYAYVDIDEDGRALGSIWWNNEDIVGDSGLNYSDTIAKIKAMTDEEIIKVSEAEYFEEDDDIDDYLPLVYEPLEENKR